MIDYFMDQIGCDGLPNVRFGQDAMAVLHRMSGPEMSAASNNVERS